MYVRVSVVKRDTKSAMQRAVDTPYAYVRALLSGSTSYHTIYTTVASNTLAHTMYYHTTAVLPSRYHMIQYVLFKGALP